jgi:hypothetical protein
MMTESLSIFLFPRADFFFSVDLAGPLLSVQDG